MCSHKSPNGRSKRQELRENCRFSPRWSEAGKEVKIDLTVHRCGRACVGVSPDGLFRLRQVQLSKQKATEIKLWLRGVARLSSHSKGNFGGRREHGPETRKSWLWINL